MNHDMKHEKRQNAAIRALASAVAGLASESGKSGYKALLDQVDLLLTTDEAEAPAVEEAAPVEPPAATPQVEHKKHSVHPEKSSHK